MTASGRKRTVVSIVLAVSERPLWRKADITPDTPKIGSDDVRITPGSGH